MFGKQRKIIGIDLDEGRVIAVEMLAKTRDAFELSKFFLASSLSEVRADLFSKGSSAVLNMPSQAVLLRSFNVAPLFLKKPQDLNAFLVRQNLPFKLEDCFWDTFVSDSRLHFIAARKDMVERQIGSFKETGLAVAGVIPVQIALHNVFIHNYPHEDKYIILNVRQSSSDLLIYENKSFANYPLSVGNLVFKQNAEEKESFCQNVQRLVNAHYLQNPQALKGGKNSLYISGLCPAAELTGLLKNLLPEFEVSALEPFKRVTNRSVASLDLPECLSSGMGLVISYLAGPGSGININLIKSKIQSEKSGVRANIFKKGRFFLAVFLSVLSLLWSANILRALMHEAALQRQLRSQMLKVLPEVKALAAERDNLQKLETFLYGKLKQEAGYLNALSAIADSRPSTMSISDLEAQLKEGNLVVLIIGTSSSYEELNDFVTALKKKDALEEVKVVASSFPDSAQQGKPVEFNLRFEIPLSEDKQ